MDEISLPYFEKQLLFSLQHQRYRDCPYYPCHSMEDQNCLFCYCPFYPCQDKTKGTWLPTTKDAVWDCSPCQWIHMDHVVRRVLELFYEGESVSHIRTTLEKEQLW